MSYELKVEDLENVIANQQKEEDFISSRVGEPVCEIDVKEFMSRRKQLNSDYKAEIDFRCIDAGGAEKKSFETYSTEDLIKIYSESLDMIEKIEKSPEDRRYFSTDNDGIISIRISTIEGWKEKYKYTEPKDISPS